MQIHNFGTKLNSAKYHNIVSVDFLSKKTILDAELIFFDIEHVHNSLLSKIKENYLSKQSQITEQQRNHDAKFKHEIFEKIIDRKKQFNEFFEIGRILIITNPKFLRIDFDFQDKPYEIDLINCFDITKPSIVECTGNNIEIISNQSIESKFEIFLSRLEYNFYLKEPKGIPLMYIKDTNYLLSEYYKIKNGLLIILPSFTGIRIEEDYLIDAVTELKPILLEYSNVDKQEIPNWVKSYFLQGEKEEFEKLENLKKQEIELRKAIDESNSMISNFNFYKALFSSDGNTLESVVKKVLSDFGFEIIQQDNKRDDLILKDGENVAVIEIKGLSKSAGEKNAAQLEKWVSNYITENEVKPKGILIVNTYKNLPIEDRKEQDFPTQMLPYTKSREHCLITGIQLLCIYTDFRNGNLNKEKISKFLFNTVGELKYTNDLSLFVMK
ncbi:MAG TPA: hypothetical protein DER09_05055 [Prolixibacteraceae bacterium]|nr:hypothetical protein [Prolixibacteraceae bacterium]